MKHRLLILLFTTILLAGCNYSSGDKELNTIKFAYAKWDSLQVHNSIAGKIIEEGYEYETEIVSGSTAAAIQRIRQGDIHVFMKIWVGNVHELYDKAFESGEMEKLTINFDDNSQGLYVPTYVIEGDPERGIESMAPEITEFLSKYKTSSQLVEAPLTYME